MSNFVDKLRLPTVLLFAYLIITNVATGVYEAAQVESNPALFLLGPIGFYWALGLWLQRDLHARGLSWALDTGFFLYIGWLVLMPYYLIKTRGAVGILIILAFIAINLGSMALGICLYVFLGPNQ